MNSYGKLFQVTIFGESHQDVVGVLISGVKPGIKFDINELILELELRKPKLVGTTKRIETDYPNIKTGIFNGYTTGSPILITFDNENKNSDDYINLSNHPRPSHADFVSKIKYDGFNDYRGGGRFSGRLTIGLVAAGFFAKKMIPFNITSKIIRVGEKTDLDNIDEYLDLVKENNDSVGGSILVNVSNMIIGLGEPFFDSIESEISKMMFSIPGVKGISFGNDNIYYGSLYNDMIINSKGKTLTNNNGGINGGISNGNDIFFKVNFRPTASIKKPQNTFNFMSNKIEELNISGRHDVCFLRRCNIILENATAICLCDLYLRYLAYKNEKIN